MSQLSDYSILANCHRKRKWSRRKRLDHHDVDCFSYSRRDTVETVSGFDVMRPYSPPHAVRGLLAD